MLLANGLIDLGPSDNIALDQPRVAVELSTPVANDWESVGPSFFNTFLLDTGANSVLAMATAVSDMSLPPSEGGTPYTYDTQGVFLEAGVAGDHEMDISVPYRLDFAGSNGQRKTVTQRTNWGAHNGLDDQATLTDSTKSWVVNGLVGMTVRNLDEGSGGLITANTATTITANLIGGTENLWDAEDHYDVVWGSHNGLHDQATLTDSTKSWTIDELVGMVVMNLDNGSNGLISANTADTITASLSGGTENDWDNGDRYDVVPLKSIRLLSDAHNDFSMFGPWGLAGMPAMVDRVTSLDMTVWSGGGSLDELFMRVDFSDQTPAPAEDEGGETHRYTVAVDNRLAFDPLDQMVSGDPPVWADIPFLTAVPVHNGVSLPANALLDTGAQMSVISKQFAFDLGLDANNNGDLDDEALRFETVGGVGGTVSAPVLFIDEVRVPTEQGVDLVWTDLQWLVLDIEVPGEAVTLDVVFGSDLLTSGWVEAFLELGDDGYFQQVHFDFREMDTLGTGQVHFDLTPAVDHVIPPGPGMRIWETLGDTVVGEAGQEDHYRVVLTSQPASGATVQVDLSLSNGQVTAVDDANQGNAYLTFNDSNWNVPQVVLVSANQDDLAEGSHTSQISHTLSSLNDPSYNGVSGEEVTVSITDDDSTLLEIVETDGSTNVAEGGTTDSFTIRPMQVHPSGATVVEWASNDPQMDATNPDPFMGMEMFNHMSVFENTNWQTIDVAAIDDTLAEGPHTVDLVLKVLDNLGNTLGQQAVTIHITDNDTPGVTISQSASSTAVSEDGATDSYTVVLKTKPDAPVTIDLNTSPDGELSVVDQLTFTDTDWYIPQTVQVAAVNDSVAEGERRAGIEHVVSSSDPDYNGIAIPDVKPISAYLSVTVTDNDTAAVEILQTGGDTAVVEGGATDTYDVVLTSQPLSQVEVLLDADDQVAVDPVGPLGFTPDDWDRPRTVRVSAIDDTLVEAVLPHTGAITHTVESADAGYHGIAVASVSVNVTDNDEPTPLGEISLQELNGVDPSQGALWYELTTARRGILSIEAVNRPAGGTVRLSLFAENRQEPPLADVVANDGVARLDWEAPAAGVTYFLRLTGDGLQVDLRLANLVDRQGTTVSVAGTESNDTFVFQPGSSRQVTINEFEYSFDGGEATHFTFEGSEGMDTIILHDSPGNETLVIGPGELTLAGPDFTVAGGGFERLLAYARAGGHDTVRMNGSPGSDQFRATPLGAKMTGDGFYHRVKSFDVVHAYSGGDGDVALLRDSERDDEFRGSAIAAQMRDVLGDFDVTAERFDRVFALSTAGGHDTARLYEPADAAVYEETPYEATFSGEGFDFTLRRFDEVQVDPAAGSTTDSASLYLALALDRVTIHPPNDDSAIVRAEVDFVLTMELWR